MKSLGLLIIVLGSPNTETGKLLPIAKARLDATIEAQQKNTHSKILLTGGFGEHFNRTDTPHAEYARQYLQERISSHCILEEIALSANTIDDAIKSKPIVDVYNPSKLLVISSAFHLARVHFIFDYLFYPRSIMYFAARNSLPSDELNKAIAHEKRQLKKLKALSSQELASVFNKIHNG